MTQIIPVERSLIFNADVADHKLTSWVSALADVEGLSTYKLGMSSHLGRLTLPTAVGYIRDQAPDKKAFFDYQKAGSDVPERGAEFAHYMAEAEVDAAIIFPFTGPDVLDRWIKELQDKHIPVIVGGEMTHAHMRASEGGFIAEESFFRIYEQAIELGVRDFVNPGTKNDRFQQYKAFLDQNLSEDEYTLYAFGFGKQGGDLKTISALSGPRFHAGVGSAIYESQDPVTVAENYVKLIRRE